MDTAAFFTSLGTVLTILGGVWAIVSYKTHDIEKRMESQDEKIFFLATGKTLREAILESKKNENKSRI